MKKRFLHDVYVCLNFISARYGPSVVYSFVGSRPEDFIWTSIKWKGVSLLDTDLHASSNWFENGISRKVRIGIFPGMTLGQVPPIYLSVLGW